jgi:uncharacterized protein (TIGR02145 family)
MKNSISIFLLLIVSSLSAQTIMNIHQSNGTVLQIPINTIDSITYTINNPGTLATLTTASPLNITGNSASAGGTISSDGGSTVTQRGICWSTSPSPTTANFTTNNGSGTGTFASSMSGLLANTTYYYAAYAINSAGTAYGNEYNFTTGNAANPSYLNPSSTYGQMSDIDGNTYATIIINTQEWMAENLRTTKYRNGDIISNVTDNAQWNLIISGAYCTYNNNQTDAAYGNLYNWYAVADSRHVCPTGWHEPSDGDWNDLLQSLDLSTDVSAWGFQSGVAGGKLKSVGTQYWTSPNDGATNSSGFSALAGGMRSNTGAFSGLGDNAYFWTKTEYISTQGVNRNIFYNNPAIFRDYPLKKNGYPVRCVKD